MKKQLENVALPSYKQLQETVENQYEELQRKELLIAALEASLSAFNSSINKMANEMKYWKKKYNEEHERAERLFDKLEEKVGLKKWKFINYTF